MGGVVREGGEVLGSAKAQRSPPVGQPRKGPTGEDSSDVPWRMGGKRVSCLTARERAWQWRGAPRAGASCLTAGHPVWLELKTCAWERGERSLEGEQGPVMALYSHVIQ